jgi:hypothetical protein
LALALALALATAMTVIAVVNESPDITDKQARLMTEACRLQIVKHVAPLWALEPWAVRFYTKEKYVPQDSLEIVILEDEENADALGYHHETPNGHRYGRVFTRPVLGDGGAVTEAAHSVSTVLSHEVIEAFIDPDINLWAEGRPGEMWAYEACDPVQEDAYRIRANGRLVYVANFVLPTWFDLQNPKGTRYDYLRLVDKPFRMTSGGYAIFWNGTGAERIKYGRRTRRRKDVKNHVAARSHRRTSGRIEF